MGTIWLLNYAKHESDDDNHHRINHNGSTVCSQPTGKYRWTWNNSVQKKYDLPKFANKKDYQRTVNRCF